MESESREAGKGGLVSAWSILQTTHAAFLEHQKCYYLYCTVGPSSLCFFSCLV